ncbi:NUDIX domain-containing protein [Roseobacteraceae bacterium S113]
MFLGAKCALFLGADLVVLRRDDKPGLLWPGALDLPGGGAEAGETPEETVLREISEEIGLRLAPDVLFYRRKYQKPEGFVWFFAAHLTADRASDIVFGNEGQGWGLMTAQAFMSAPDAVPVLAERVGHYIATNPDFAGSQISRGGHSVL